MMTKLGTKLKILPKKSRTILHCKRNYGPRTIRMLYRNREPFVTHCCLILLAVAYLGFAEGRAKTRRLETEVPQWGQAGQNPVVGLGTKFLRS